MSELKEVAEAVTSGAVVVYPTDTVYGLGCNPFNEYAVKRVFRLKMRKNRPAPILCNSIDKAGRLIELDERALKLAKLFWPGQLTIVGRAKELRLSPLLIGKEGRVGVRVPDNRCALTLIELCGGMLVGTSANRSGLKSPCNIDDVLNSLSPDFDFLIDGGQTEKSVESTVIDITGDDIMILREGFVRGDLIYRSLGMKER